MWQIRFDIYIYIHYTYYTCLWLWTAAGRSAGRWAVFRRLDLRRLALRKLWLTLKDSSLLLFYSVKTFSKANVRTGWTILPCNRLHWLKTSCGRGSLLTILSLTHENKQCKKFGCAQLPQARCSRSRQTSTIWGSEQFRPMNSWIPNCLIIFGWGKTINQLETGNVIDTSR